MISPPRKASKFVFCLAWLIALSSLISGTYASLAHAGEGIFLMGNDAIQLGRASSGVASPRSSYWSYMNPASMVDLERRMDINLYAISDTFKLKPRGLLGNRLDGDLVSDEFFMVPSTGIILPLKKGTLGGGIFAPCGSGVEYPHSRNIISRLFSGNGDRRLAYQHVRGVLAYARELDNGWALGAGLHLSVSRFRTDHLTLGLSTASYDNQWDTAFGAGVSVGAYRHWDRFAVGASYMSRHWSSGMDKYDDLLSAPLDMPRSLQAGIAYKLMPTLELTVDYKWLQWRRVRSYGSPIFRGGGFGWTNQNSVKLGLEWQATPKWTFMTGYAYNNTPIRSNGVFLASLTPVIFEHHITGGVSFAINEKHAVHLTGGWAPKTSMKENGDGDLLSLLGKGTEIEASAISALLGYTYKW
jgi:long-chain fatty acid transport protein